MAETNYKYQQVLNIILERIVPSLKIGDLLPTPEELCRECGVSLITVNKALRLLVEQQVIRRVKNRGSVLLHKTAPAEKAVAAAEPFSVLTIYSHWQITGVIERIFQNFKRYNPSFEYQIHLVESRELIADFLKGDFDLVFCNTELSREMITTPSLASRLVRLDSIEGLQFGREDFFPEVIPFCSRGDEWLFLPLTSSPMLQIINLDYPGMAGVETAALGDWTRFRQVLREIRREPAPLFLLYNSLNYIEPILRMHGVRLFSEDGKCCELNKPEAIAVIEELRQLCCDEKLLIFSGSPQALELERTSQLLARRMAVRWASALDISSGNLGQHWRIMPLPAARQPAAHLFLEGAFCGRRKNLSQVRDILNYFQSVSAQSLFDGCAGINCRRDFARLRLAELESGYPGLSRTIFESLPFAEPAGRVYRQKAWRVVLDYLALVFNGVMPAAEACQAASAEANRILAEAEF